MFSQHCLLNIKKEYILKFHKNCDINLYEFLCNNGKITGENVKKFNRKNQEYSKLTFFREIQEI